MTDVTLSPAETQASSRPYREPQKLLVPCPGCGATVLRGLMIDGRVKKQSPPLTPIFGKMHVCAEERQEGDRP